MQWFLLAITAPIIFAGSLYGNEAAIDREIILKGIREVYSLNHAEAWKIFGRLKDQYPESPVVQGMLALTAYNELLFDTRNLAVFQYGMPIPFEDIQPPEEMVEQKENRFLEANNALLSLCVRLIEKNPQDPVALYFQGMAYENMAMYTVTFHGNKVEAANLAKTAGRIHKEVLSLDPNMVDAKTSTAVPEYIVGSLPFGIRWLGLIIGVHGDKKDAMEKLQEVVDSGIFRSADSLLVMALLNAWKGDANTAVSLFQRLRNLYKRNFLFDIGLAVAYEGAMEDPMTAIGIYKKLLEELSQKAPGIYPGEIHFRIGKNYARLKDYDSALEHYQTAVSSRRRDLETEPLVYYNMALVYEKLGNKKEAKECYRHTAEYTGPTQLIHKEIDRAREKTK